MNDINSVVLVGRLTKDAEVGRAGSTSISKPSIAVNRSVKKGDEWTSEASFIELEIWGKTAESLCKYLTKGQMIAVSGELKQDRWQDPEGNPRYKIKIVAEHVEFKPEFKNKTKEDEEQKVEEEREEVYEGVS